MSHMNPIHILKLDFLKIHFNTIPYLCIDFILIYVTYKHTKDCVRDKTVSLFQIINFQNIIEQM
jgi:hypothetical protein